MFPFRSAWRQLRQHWKPLLLFEILWKLLTILIVAPACAGLLQLTIRAAGLKYLTNANLISFLKSPWTILLLLLVLTAAALYTLFEIAAVCNCFSTPVKPKTPVRNTLRSMTCAGLHSLKHFFRGGLLLPLHLLVLIPLMQFSATSDIFTAMGIPDFLAYYITKKDFLLPIYVGVILLCCLLSVRWIFSTPLFVEYRCSFRSARKCSRKLVKGRFWKTLFSVLLWNCFYFAVMLLSLCAITAVVLLIVKLRNSGTSLTTQAMQVFKILMQVVLWSFSFFATPIYVTHVTTLFQKRREQFPEVELP